MSEILGGQTVRTRQAEEAIAAGLAVVKGTGNNQILLPASANLMPIGIARDAGSITDPKYADVAVVEQGEVTAVAGGTIVPGNLLRVAAGGKLVAIGSEAVGQQVNVCAQAMEAAAADEEFAALINKFVLGDQFEVTYQVGGAAAATAANWGLAFIAPFACQLIQAVRRFEVAGSSGAAFMIGKAATTVAKGSATDMLAAAMSLEATADANATATLHATVANRNLAAGDAVVFTPAGTLTNLIGVHATLTFRRL